MPDKPPNPDPGHSPDSSQSNARLDQFVREGLSEEHLQADWAAMRGSTPVPDRIDVSQELTDALRLRKIPQKAAAVACLMILGFAAWFGHRPEVLHLQTPQTVAAVLPRDLALNLSGQKVTLAASDITYSTATFSSPRGPRQTVEVYDIQLSALGQNGLTNFFDGKLFVTNALDRKTILGTLLRGDLFVGTNAPVPVNQPFRALP